MKNCLINKTLARLMVYSSVLAILVTGCKKDPKIAPGDPAPVNPGSSGATGTRAELTKDSIFLYAKEVYLWNDALPSYEQFNPRKYNQSSNELENFNRELFAITQFKINPSTGKPYEFFSETSASPKYSYITDHESKDPSKTKRISAVNLEGVGTDFGFGFRGLGTEASYQIYIRFVNPGSPAAKAGLSRGDIITQLNDRKFGSGFANDVNFILSAFDMQTFNLAGIKPDGTTFTRTLSKSTYTSNPIFRDTVITVSGKKIGYFAFARFSSAANAESVLTEVFSKFASSGVTDLVVDFRYNGGGFVSTAEHLTNLIAPSSLNGKVMFTEHFNSLMQSGQANILKKQPLTDGNDRQRFSNGKALTYFDVDYSVAGNTNKFSKKGTLEGISKVVFIVTGNTASASELVINNLKPHLDVKIVGEKSYGKPVGFFPIKIDKYDVYYSMFQSRNSVGEGDYFAGFTPDKTAFDDFTRNFGEPQEVSFATAIKYITQGTFVASTSVKVMGRTMSSSDLRVMGAVNDESFKGMIETRVKIK